MSSKRLGVGLALGLMLALGACGPRGKAGASDAQVQAEAAKATAFLTKNAKLEGVHTLPSGLQYKIEIGRAHV